MGLKPNQHGQTQSNGTRSGPREYQPSHQCVTLLTAFVREPFVGRDRRIDGAPRVGTVAVKPVLKGSALNVSVCDHPVPGAAVRMEKA